MRNDGDRRHREIMPQSWPMKLLQLTVIMLALFAADATHVRAEDAFPSRLITIVTPLTPGTTIDILARLFADRLARRFAQPVIVANRAGAAGAIAAGAVAAAPADGYTLLFTNSGHPILGVLNKSLRFDPINDFAGVALIGAAPAIVTVSPALGVGDLKEFVALARARPGRVNYGSAGIGTSTHIAGALFARLTGTDLVHVPYSVSATIIADLIGGRIQAAFVPAAFILPMLEDHRLAGLAVSAGEPISAPVRVPTALSQGVGYEYETWYGILAPARTPKPVLHILHQAISALAGDPELVAKIRAQGIDPKDMGLADFDAYIRNDMARLAPLLRTIAAER
jgi:tripartite-type tricarboxylate transporter receptor subunit TctC